MSLSLTSDIQFERPPSSAAKVIVQFYHRVIAQYHYARRLIYSNISYAHCVLPYIKMLLDHL